MAQADAKEDVLDIEDYNPVSESVEYGLYSVSSQKHLSGRGGQKNPKMKLREPKGDKYLTWKFELVEDGKYALTPLSAPNYYLDGRDGAKDPLMKKGNPKTDQSLQWQVIKVKENKVALQGVASGKCLSGRGGQEDPKMQKRDVSKEDEYLQWILVPLNYKLHATVSEYDFGSPNKVNEILSKSKQWASDSSQIVEAELGLEVSYEFEKEMENTFTTSRSHSWGIGVSVETNAKLPMVGGSTITVTGSYQSTKAKERSKSEMKKYKVGYDFAPKQAGNYKVGMILYSASNVKLDYSAKVDFKGKEENNKDNVLAGSDVPALLFYYQCDAKITRADKSECSGTIYGTVVADYVVETETYCISWDGKE